MLYLSFNCSSIGPKLQLPTPLPQPPSINRQHHHQPHHPRRDPRLNAKTPPRPHRLGPPHLKIRNDEPAQHPTRTNPRRRLPARLRVRFEIVGRQSDGCDHDAKDVEAPGEGGEHVVVSVLEAETDEDETREGEGGGEVDY